MKLLIRWIVTTLGFLAGAYILPGVEVDGWLVALVAALILGIINTLIRPVLVVLTLPITIVTLGLFTFVLNALLILLVDELVPGFTVAGFGWALVFSLVIALVSFVLHALIPGER